MLARLGAVVAESSYVFKSDKVLEFFGRIVENFECASLYFGIEIVSVRILDLKQPCHMVDTCDLFADRLLYVVPHTEILEKL